MNLSKQENEELRNMVSNHFQTNFMQILENGGLQEVSVNCNHISPIAQVELSAIEGMDNAYIFNADFRVKEYKITYQGTVNKNREIKSESFWKRKEVA